MFLQLLRRKCRRFSRTNRFVLSNNLMSVLQMSLLCAVVFSPPIVVPLYPNKSKKVFAPTHAMHIMSTDHGQLLEFNSRYRLDSSLRITEEKRVLWSSLRTVVNNVHFLRNECQMPVPRLLSSRWLLAVETESARLVFQNEESIAKEVLRKYLRTWATWLSVTTSPF